MRNNSFYNWFKKNNGLIGTSEEKALLIWKESRKDLINKSQFTPAELKIIDELKNDITEKDLAKKFEISIYTIKKHRQNIRRKLGINTKKINLCSFIRNIFN